MLGLTRLEARGVGIGEGLGCEERDVVVNV